MTQQTAVAFLPLVQALAEKKIIQRLWDSPKAHWLDDECPNFTGMVPRDRFRVKPEPREWWVNEYEGGATSAGLYPTKENAREFAKRGCIGQIHVREVL